MITNIKKALDNINCHSSEITLSELYSKNYGIEMCSIDDSEGIHNNPKYLKLKRDILKYYNTLSEFELNILKTSNKLNKEKTNKLLSVDDELYSWLMNNFNNIYSTINNYYNTTSDKYAYFEQTLASTTWTFTHNLGYNPVINVYDMSGNVLTGYVATYPTLNRLVLTWENAMSGKIIAS